jgi:hypothetical protein
MQQYITDQDLYEAAIAYEAEAMAWQVRYSAKCQGQNILPVQVNRNTEVIETGFEDWEAAQRRYVFLRRVASMRAANEILNGILVRSSASEA